MTENHQMAWQRIATAPPRFAGYQGKVEREYLVVRLTVH